MMGTPKVAVAVFVAALLALTSACSTPAPTPAAKKSERKAMFTWDGGGATGSNTVNMAMALSDGMRRDQLPVFVKTSAGSMDSLMQVVKKESDFGTTSTKTVQDVWSGAPGFEKAQNFSQVISLTPSFFAMVVRADSTIKHWKDFAGKRVNANVPGTTMLQSTGDVIDVAVKLGMLPSNHGIKIEQQNTTETVPGVVDGRFAGGVVVSSGGTLIPANMEGFTQHKRIPFRFVGIPNELQAGLRERGWVLANPANQLAAWRAAQPDLAEVPNLIGIVTIAVASEAIPEDVVHRFLTLLFKHLPEASKQFPLLAQVSGKNGLQLLNRNVPVHPGAARYYKETGVWTDDFKIAGK